MKDHDLKIFKEKVSHKKGVFIICIFIAILLHFLLVKVFPISNFNKDSFSGSNSELIVTIGKYNLETTAPLPVERKKIIKLKAGLWEETPVFKTTKFIKNIFPFPDQSLKNYKLSDNFNTKKTIKENIESQKKIMPIEKELP
jgi:hypothetical protein